MPGRLGRDLPTAILAVLLVAAAVGLGLGASVLARKPAPTPTPVARTATPAPSTPRPSPTTDPAVFHQRLSAGCATADNVWVVSDGGSLLRYDGANWEEADETLRSLVRASCEERSMIAVGPAGAVLLVDERAQQIRSESLGIEDLSGVSDMRDGVLVSGTRGTVQLLAGGQWQPFAAGIDEDLYAIRGFSLTSAWAVGAGGVSYRLEPAGWREVATGVDAALFSVAARSATDVVAVGERGTIVRFDGKSWSAVRSGVETVLRDVLAASDLWIVGDAGVVLTGDPLRRVDLGTTCDLRAVFARGDEVWIVGSSGSRGGVWRVRGGAVAQQWGECAN